MLEIGRGEWSSRSPTMGTKNRNLYIHTTSKQICNTFIFAMSKYCNNLTSQPTLQTLLTPYILTVHELQRFAHTLYVHNSYHDMCVSIYIYMYTHLHLHYTYIPYIVCTHSDMLA